MLMASLQCSAFLVRDKTVSLISLISHICWMEKRIPPVKPARVTAMSQWSTMMCHINRMWVRCSAGTDALHILYPVFSFQYNHKRWNFFFLVKSSSLCSLRVSCSAATLHGPLISSSRTSSTMSAMTRGTSRCSAAGSQTPSSSGSCGRLWEAESWSRGWTEPSPWQGQCGQIEIISCPSQ